MIPTSQSESGKNYQRIYAVCLDHKGRVLSESPNLYHKSHPYQYECACEVDREEAIYLHAEISAIIRNKHNRRIHKIVVARIGNSGRTLLAKPCGICSIAISEYGIEEIEYTTTE